ncbi:MAG: NAD(P)H-dependent oxidoreductase [Prevotellaceae bacterium]|jgi:NAD(P)H dehydrogenase (quinone)|nr:NAD(P)H-dependent oxidoreductase [Prevotellaceae bacterium]
MKHLIIFAHPNPASFNSSLVKALHNHLLNQGDEVKLRHLYELRFNPVLSADDFSSIADNKTPKDIEIEQEYVKWADHIIFVFPVWWGGMPAIMKGYIDRVFADGFAYEYVADGSNGLLSPRKGSTICSTGAYSEDYKHVHDAMNVLSIETIFGFTGITFYKSLFYGGVPLVSDEVRNEYIQNALREFSDINRIV